VTISIRRLRSLFSTYFTRVESMEDKMWLPASITITRTNGITSRNQRLQSLFTKSYSSEVNSMLVGPPPTITNVRSLCLSLKVRLGHDAVSKFSMILFRICIAWLICFKKYTFLWLVDCGCSGFYSSMQSMPLMPNVAALHPTAMISLS